MRLQKPEETAATSLWYNEGEGVSSRQGRPPDVGTVQVGVEDEWLCFDRGWCGSRLEVVSETWVGGDAKEAVKALSG